MSTVRHFAVLISMAVTLTVGCSKATDSDKEGTGQSSMVSTGGSPSSLRIPTPTPTPIPGLSPEPVPTPSPAPTPTPIQVPTATPTPTPTPIPVPVQTAVGRVTPEVTRPPFNPTPPPILTPPRTLEPAPTPTPVQTAVGRGTPEITRTLDPTPTLTPTRTLGPTPTPTPTRSPAEIGIRLHRTTPRSITFYLFDTFGHEIEIQYCRGLPKSCSNERFVSSNSITKTHGEYTLSNLTPLTPYTLRVRAVVPGSTRMYPWTVGGMDLGEAFYTAPLYKMSSLDQETNESKPVCRVPSFSATEGYGYTYLSPYTTTENRLKCRIQYSPPNLSATSSTASVSANYSEVQSALIYYTPTTSCINAALNHGNRRSSITSVEGPIFQVSDRKCTGQLRMDVSYIRKHCFLVETLAPSTCRLEAQWFCFDDCQ